MHYEIDYKRFATVAERDAAAVADVREFMGAERFDTVRGLFAQLEPVALDLFRLQMSFAGIQGYPVEALHRLFWPDQLVVIDAVAGKDYVCH